MKATSQAILALRSEGGPRLANQVRTNSHRRELLRIKSYEESLSKIETNEKRKDYLLNLWRVKIRFRRREYIYIVSPRKVPHEGNGEVKFTSRLVVEIGTPPK